MTPDQENKWRKEFEKKYPDSTRLIRLGNGCYKLIYMRNRWEGYLAGRKKAQEELKDEALMMYVPLLSEYEDRVKDQKEIIKDKDDLIFILKMKLNGSKEKVKERDELIREAMLWLINDLEDRKIIDHSSGVGIGIYQMKLGSWIEKAKKLVGEK